MVKLSHEEQENQELVEGLVRQSLNMNPELRDGRSTREFIQQMRQRKAIDGVQGSGATVKDTPIPDNARARNIAFFLDSKMKQVDDETVDLHRQMERLEQQEREVTLRAAGEIVDFLAAVVESREEAEAVMVRYDALWLSLGVKAEDLLAQAAKRRKGR